MTTIAQDLGGVVRLLEKATPGPWECGAGKAYEPQTTVYCDDALGSAVATCAHSMTALIPTEQERANAAAIAAAVNFLRIHSAEIAGALRDAERYRWLKAQNAITETPDAWTITRCDFTDEEEPIRYWVGDDLDAAIDAAMGAVGATTQEQA